MTIQETKTETIQKSLLRFTTSGNVDDGKSTLLGRLLYETHCIFEDQYAAIEKASSKRGQSTVDLSLLLDGLASEREQGITIDVAYRYFETSKRKFIVADCPGHEQYTRNMVTGASNAELALVLIDARKGIQTQSKRHGFIASLLRIPNMIVCVNKMDLMDWDKDVFQSIVKEYKEFSQKLNITHIDFVPMSALLGDNVVEKSTNMPWYEGSTLLHYLENVHPSSSLNLVDFRFPVQTVIRPHLDFRGYAGMIASGTIIPGEEVAVMPSGKTSKIKSIESFESPLKEAKASESVILTLEDEIDISRGNMIVRKNNLPNVSQNFDALICWMSEEAMKPGTQYIIKHTTMETKGFISDIHYKIDVNTLHRSKVDVFGLNDIGRVEIKSTLPLAFDTYRVNRSTGSFILIDPLSNATVAAGWIRGKTRGLDDLGRGKIRQDVSHNVKWEEFKVDRSQREIRNTHKAGVFWFTGYSGSGKSTIAKNLESMLFQNGYQVVVLDGDNVRHGLCGDLGFSDAHRTENIRRVGEVAKLFYETGHIVLCTFISPFIQDREFARKLIPENQFFEVFVKCSLDVCQRRDPKGLYKKALAGEIKEFTGVSSVYEEPQHPEIIVETDIQSLDQILESLLAKINSSLKV